MNEVTNEKQGKRKLVSCVIVKGKHSLEVAPSFQQHGIYFYPIPKGLLSEVKEGETYIGHFGKVYDTGKRDKNGVRIYTRYFIPHIPGRKGNFNERQ